MKIRAATLDDVPGLLLLIKELAIFEKAAEEVSTSEADLVRDGFGDQLFNAFVAEYQDKLIGMAITYFRYSTWKGKCLYLEDLIVSQPFRGLGAGKALFDECIRFGKLENCSRMVWQVLDWNTDAIDFYKGYGTAFDNEWVNCTLDISV